MQVVHTAAGPKFVEGETVMTADGLKFVAGVTLEDDRFVSGSFIEVGGDASRFVQGQMMGTGQADLRFIPGQLGEQEDGKQVFVPGMVVDNVFQAGQMVETKDGVVFLHGEVTVNQKNQVSNVISNTKIQIFGSNKRYFEFRVYLALTSTV